MPPKRKILKDFSLTEISPVDRPAQPTALSTILKNDGGIDVTQDIIKAYCAKSDANAISFADALLSNRVNDSLWPMTDALSASIRSIVNDTTMDTVAKSNAIAATVDAFAAKMRELITDGTDPLTKFVTDLIAGKDGGTQPDEDSTMTTTADLEKKVTDLTGQLADAIAISKLNDAEKAFMDSMDDKAKKAFTALSAKERKEQMDLAKRGDETLVVDGTTISKREVGEDVFAVMKSQQERLAKQEQDTKDALAKAENSRLEKRATDDYGHLPVEASELVPLLKAVEDMPEAVRKTAEKVMKAAEALALKGFDTQGHGNGATLESTTAAEQLDTLAKAHAKEHNVTYETAYEEVVQKNAGLYTQTLN